MELDVYYDPAGGRFSTPAAYQILKEKGITNLAPHNTKGLDQPGFKVLHMADIDFRSHYPTLKDALVALRSWSDAHSGHTPVFYYGRSPRIQDFQFSNSTKVLPFDKGSL